MSKFAAAQAKAAALAPAPKAKAAATAPAPSAKIVAVRAMSTPKTLGDMKLLVKGHETNIEDKEEEARNEPNKGKKKELENAIKKMREEDTYKKCLVAIKNVEAQAKRDAERASISGPAGSDAKASSKVVTSKDTTEEAAPTAASVEAMAEIRAAFEGKGKDAGIAKIGAVAKLEALASSTPFVLPFLPHLIDLFADSKLGAPALKAACAIVAGIRPEGHGVTSLVMPALLAGMEDKRWKVKAACIEVLKPCLNQMASATPVQLADCLPKVVAKLAEAALEVRAEIRGATGNVLREIGTLVSSPEIKKLSADLVTALAEPTNQKHTQGVLAKMGNQTFMSLIDAASLSLLMPIVVRGLKEREPMSKKWSAQIFGSTSRLVKDVEMIKPYLATFVPMLQETLTDPVAEVQRESAKAFGILEQVMPEYSRMKTSPWLFDKLRHGDEGQQTGAALALAEVLMQMDKTRSAEFIQELVAGAMEQKPFVRQGFLELTDTMPQAMKMDFVPFIEPLLPTMLMGINGNKDNDPGFRASSALVARFGDLCPELLLSAFEGAYAATLNYASNEERERQVVIREKVAVLLGKTAEKILEHKKFGQDLLTCEECSTRPIREQLLCLSFVMRFDHDVAVKRVANGTWKNVGGAPKMQKAIAPSIEKLCLRWRSGDVGPGAQKFAGTVFEDLVKTGEMSAPCGEIVQARPFVFPPLPEHKQGSDANFIVSGKAPESASNGAAGAQKEQAQRDRTMSAASKLLVADQEFSTMPECVRSHCEAISASVIIEGQRARQVGKRISANLADLLQVVVKGSGVAPVALLKKIPTLAEAAVRAALGDAFDSVQGGANESDQALLRVEDLMLMYGGGHLLLKDTVLEMKKNQRYGIVGHNGAGKTTLMKEIANHRIVGMPQDLKCVHVDDSNLGEMSKSCLTALEYVIKMAKDIGVDNAGRDTLIGVGFDEKMLDEPVADLSTGWRMRLTLAVSMLKHADLVLLDEPTNHLDKESVQWLSEYILSIKQSSVMVISHEPKFLNKVCTHVIAYVDRKLDYTEGNFDVFAAKKGLTKDQLDAMLSGNHSFDTRKKGEDGEEDGDEDTAPKVSAPMAGPPKLSFPIPGTMEGVKSGSRSVLEVKNVSFRYSKDKDYLLKDVIAKLSLSSRVAICGRNGCGKSTLMMLLCSEFSPSENEDGKYGEVWRHCNLRLAYMKQDHLKALGPFFDTSPFVYITQRFKDGYDGDLQRRLIEPEDEAEASRRALLAKEHGKYGNEVEELLSRSKQGSTLVYEVKWAGLDDPKQNTLVSISKLKQMGLDKVVIACDERIAAKAAGLDQRPLTRREILRHCEAFGIDEEMCCNRQIRGFSSGQKVRLSLAAMFWTKPHLIAIDEPTNYLDVETVDALAKALTNFRGGIVMIEPKTDFVERICNERWFIEDGKVRVEKLENGVKRQA